ncbi:RagB/SusD family nutrient uptake outer membrane protein [Pontibacter diazotrophicus]|uniref:RagB/SusD family nutrient uptake outer membrane protein n=1 Tax=Pontibacter diazotrophicus TaxID=1400979 RepID=A0A3D8LII2_9BACT|nr:RagB/SusD family nutrient uptake outer membrane protein [Pontibacter diazotrophicus]RDV17251.1 RagB/SusD family nutrient uptake outer membrane protein [Pontibacter diazotrophicus]
MRKISLFICSALMVGLVSCEKELDQAPLSDASAANFYRDAADFEQAVNGIYAQLRPYPDRHFNLSEVRSDNMYATTEIGVREHEPINNFVNTLETNSLVISAWNENFNGIMRANTVLDRLNASVVPDDAQRNRFEGEARFLRALYYFDLVRLYGKVPVYDASVSPAEALEVPRSPVAEVYSLIVSDLNTAIEMLPPSHGAVNRGRATSWAAKSLLALVHLTRSAPTYGIEGPGLDVNEYAEALTLLNDVINNGPYAWVEDYSSIFDYNNENNPDIVFDIQFLSGGLGTGGTYPGTMAPNSYFNAVGIPFPAGLETKPLSSDLIETFAPEDERLGVAVQQGFTDEFGNSDPRPFFRKFLDEDDYGLDRFDWGINFPIIRYTDVLMMKAEAILQGAPGTQEEVDEIINMARVRAGLEPVSGVTLDMYLEERRREFAGEGHRWHDLVRTGQVIEEMNEWLPTEDTRNVMPETLDPNYIIYPIPFSQLQVKEGLYEQNPGY